MARWQCLMCAHQVITALLISLSEDELALLRTDQIEIG